MLSGWIRIKLFLLSPIRICWISTRIRNSSFRHNAADKTFLERSFQMWVRDWKRLSLFTRPPAPGEQYEVFLRYEENGRTVCPGTSDPPEKKYLIWLHKKTRFTPFISYYDNLG